MICCSKAEFDRRVSEDAAGLFEFTGPADACQLWGKMFESTSSSVTRQHVEVLWRV